MLTQDRHDKIIQILSVKNSATVTELAKELDASESTIRRDLRILAGMGRLKKVHGGATALFKNSAIAEDDFLTKSTLFVEEKKFIGRAAAAFVTNDDFVFIDAGTTTLAMIAELQSGLRATFVTNGIAHGRALIQKGLKTYILGGRIKPNTEAVVGSEAIINIRKFNYTKTFIGVNGITPEQGYTTPDEEEAAIKAEAIAHGRRNYILSDHSKFGKITPLTFADIADATIITDELSDSSYKEYTIIREAVI